MFISLLLGTHMYFTKCAFIQRKLPLGIRWSVLPEKEAGTGRISPFSRSRQRWRRRWNRKYHQDFHGDRDWRPGAIFWCWITGVLGITNLLCGVLFVVRFRVQKTRWIYTGRPMYVIEHPRFIKKRNIQCSRAGSCARLVWDETRQSVQSAAAVDKHWT